MQTTGTITAAALASGAVLAAEPTPPAPLKGRIHHSLVHWCYADHWKDINEFCLNTKALGATSIELADVELWPAMKKHGLTCAIAGSHGFVKGLNDPANHDEHLALLKKRIDQSAEFGCPSVITFTGMRTNEKGVTIPDDVGMENCVKALKKIAGYAEEKKITLCLEHLNSRVSNHPMKGHPGYQGDHVDYCFELLRQVNSPRVKLLFDLYHVQIMDGDLITRIRENHELIGHIHTAGNPGRGELHLSQEIQFEPIMQTLVDVGYQGYVGHEFIPTIDPKVGLQKAIQICDV